MMFKTLASLAFVAMCFVSSGSALNWEPCDGFGTNVTQVEIPECVSPPLSPPAFIPGLGCPLESGSSVNYAVQYSLDLDQKPIDRAVVRLDFDNGDYSEAVAATNELTRVEIWKNKYIAGSLPVSGQKKGQTKMRLTIRELGTQVPQVCLEIPVKLQ